MNHKLILFRADGGPGIGMGHIVRCLALAGELRREGVSPEFALSASDFAEGESVGIQVGFLSRPDPVVERMVCERGFSFYPLESDEDFFARLKMLSPLALVVDNYLIGTDELAAIKKLVPLLVAIDDLNDRELPVDLIINGNVTGPSLGYKADRRLLLGPEYVLLRPEFRARPARTIAERAQRVMVTLGGSDDLNLTPLVLEALRGTGLHISVVVGPRFNRNLMKELVNDWNGIMTPTDKKMVRPVLSGDGEIPVESRCPADGNTVEFLESPDMAALMCRADLAVSAGGSTLYELCATGTPAVVVAVAENQVASSRALHELGCVHYLGYYSDVFPPPYVCAAEESYPDEHWRIKCPHSDTGRGAFGGYTTAEGSILRRAVLSLAVDPSRRAEMSRRGRSLVDGLGAKRCAAVIMEMLHRILP